MTDEGMQKLPLGKGSAEQVVVKYPSDRRLHAGRHLGRFTSATTSESKNFVYHRGGERSPVSSSQRGRATKRQVLC